MYSEDKGLIQIANVQSEKNVGIIFFFFFFYLNMTLRENINSHATKASNIMGIVRRTYTYLDIESFKLIFKLLARPHLEHGAPIWNPQLKRDITDLENVQRRATRQIPVVKGMSYQDPLWYRWLRGDMIETYKLLHNVYDRTLPHLLSQVQDSTTRGHNPKLPKNRARTNIKAHSFTHWTVNDWNNLPDEVISARSINPFKNRIDTHWKNHP